MPAVLAMEDAARTLLAPLCPLEERATDLLFWLGLSSWLLSAALACETARRCLRDRAALRLASPLDPWDLPPETDL